MGMSPHRNVRYMQPLLSRRLGMRLGALRLIKNNGRCGIYRAFEQGNAVVIKQYWGQDPTLARREEQALRLYSKVCEDLPDVLPVRPLVFNGHTNTLCMEHIEGRPLTDVIEQARTDRAQQVAAARFVALAGAVLRRLYEVTRRSGVPPSQFLREYMEYVSTGLRSVPVLGPAVFQDYAWEARVLWDELVRAEVPTSLTHGDPALNNILVRGSRIALIDFANTNPAAHLLSDGYALSVSLRTKWLSNGYRGRLFAALHEGLDGPSFPEPVHRFYWELQRRRWLFLKLVQGTALAHAQGLRSMSHLGVRLPLREAG